MQARLSRTLFSPIIRPTSSSSSLSLSNRNLLFKPTTTSSTFINQNRSLFSSEDYFKAGKVTPISEGKNESSQRAESICFLCFRT